MLIAIYSITFDMLSSVMPQRSNTRLELDQLKKKETPPPIDCLPVELLLKILSFALVDDDRVCGRTRMVSAHVSRHWRDVILNCPAFWTTIELYPGRTPPFIKAHVERSRNYLVDINIHHWFSGEEFIVFPKLLDAIIPCAHRWRSFTVNSNRTPIMHLIEKELENVASFPSLTRAIFDTLQNDVSFDSKFLAPEKTPLLETLQIRASGSFQDAITSFDATHVTLNLTHPWSPPSPFSLSLASEKMTSLKLVGTTYGWNSLHPNSLHLPRLQSLHIEIDPSNPLLQAIVSPNLSRLDYMYPSDMISEVFDQITSKFPNLRYFGFRSSEEVDGSEARAICTVFPGVSHVELDIQNISAFFGLTNGSCAADRWVGLEHLSFSSYDQLPSNDLVQWLKRRKHRGLPMLQVELRSSHMTRMAEPNPLDTLPKYCTLRLLERIP